MAHPISALAALDNFRPDANILDVTQAEQKHHPASFWFIWAVFGLSIIVFIAAILFIIAMMFLSRSSSGPNGDAQSELSLWGPLAAAVTSFITSVSSLIGLILGWKKNKSDTAKADLEVQKLQLDLDRARLEMEKSPPRKARHPGKGHDR